MSSYRQFTIHLFKRLRLNDTLDGNETATVAVTVVTTKKQLEWQKNQVKT